eukprot:PhF_6_TR951/c0_g1_i2/m.1770
MEISVHVCLTTPSPSGSKILNVRPDGIDYNTPPPLVEAAFPTAQTFFPLEKVTVDTPASALYSTYLRDLHTKFQQRTNAVVFAYGARATPKRQMLFAPDGLAAAALKAILATPQAGYTYTAMCYALGTTENVRDMLDLRNDQGVVTESVKEGPKVRQVEKATLRSAADVGPLFEKITTNYTQHFQKVLKDHDPKSNETPAYQPESIMFTFCAYDTREALDANVECNSLQFVALADSERPTLCGIDVEQLNAYEKTHKTLAAVVGVLGAIRCNRLRIPYGKSKLTSLLKRTYNAEKNNANNELNKPTATFMFINAFTDDAHAEETYHTLTMGRRIVSVIGGGVGPVSRDLAVEKWRLEQDIAELKDEL